MSMERAVALVLRTTDWSETSRIATLWTRELGKVRALAKGGRRLKSSFDSALDLLTVCGIVLLRKSSESLDLLTEAQVVRRFARLREDLSALYAAYYVAELLADWTEDHDPHPLLFDQALATLDRAGDGRGGRPARDDAIRGGFSRRDGVSPGPRSVRDLSAEGHGGGGPGVQRRGRRHPVPGVPTGPPRRPRGVGGGVAVPGRSRPAGRGVAGAEGGGRAGGDSRAAGPLSDGDSREAPAPAGLLGVLIRGGGRE